MSHTPRFALAAFATLLTASPLTAQEPAVAYPSNNWSYIGHSSTATEGYLRGQASVVDAAGQYNYYTSLAAVNRAEAIRRGIENEKLYVKTYLEIKEMRAEFWEKYKPRPANAEIRRMANELAQPDQLSDEQFNRTTGQLYWPHILRQPEYAAMRNRVDELFAARTIENSGDGSSNQREIDSILDGMHRLLVHNADSISVQQFSDANSFIRSTAYEAQIPSDRVAVPKTDDDSVSNSPDAPTDAVPPTTPPVIKG